MPSNIACTALAYEAQREPNADSMWSFVVSNPKDIEEAVRELKKNKSSGHDNKCAEHLMFACQSISYILCNV